MSEVNGVAEAAVPAPAEESHEMKTPVLPPKIIAPALRVEELRDDMVTSVYVTTSDEESGFGHGDVSGGSDVEGRVSPGGDLHLPEFKEPEDELKDRIIKQVEFYFSDANILKDAFLLKHVRRNKQGFVSLKLITSFRKMKSLSKDYRVVAFSLRQSDQLEVNEEGNKVRRKNPLPEHDETTPSRTVVAINLPMENPTVETVAELFSSCGEVALLRILRPGKTIPPDVRKHINKHPEIGTTVCAVVEFETYESAKKATETMCNKDDWRKGMYVVILSNQAKKEKVGKRAQKSDTEKSDTNDSMDENTRRKSPYQKKSNNRMKLSAEEYSGNASSGSEMEPDSYKRRGSDDNRQHRFPVRSSLSPQQDPNRLSPSNTPRSSPRTSPRASPRGSPNMRRRNIGKSPLAQDTLGVSPKVSPSGSPEARRKGEVGGSESPSQSPWVQRRKAQAGSLSSSPMASPLMGRRAPDCIVRQPLGPGETGGFYGGKGRGKPPGIAV